MAVDPYETMANSIIFGVLATRAAVEIDVSGVGDQMRLKKAIQDKGYDVTDTKVGQSSIFIVCLLPRRIYPVIDRVKSQGS